MEISLVKPSTTVPKIPVPADTATGTEVPVVELLPTATVLSNKMRYRKGLLCRSGRKAFKFLDLKKTKQKTFFSRISLV